MTTRSARWCVALAMLICGGQALWSARVAGNRAPTIGDAAEVHNIAYALAHGRGYRFDWDDAGWRALWLRQNNGGQYDGILCRRGSHPTMIRPPLMPLLVAATIRLSPGHSFLAWRATDAVLFAAAAGLLCAAAVSRGGAAGFAAMLAVLLADPIRREFVPGWWTEGLAFDLIAALVWLVADGRRRLGPTPYAVAAGVALGLVCLDRSLFVLLIPPLCVVLSLAPGGPPGRLAWARAAVVIGVVAVAIQLPWWARNVAVAGRFVPLGTQGGFNLPDEYGPRPLRTDGVWDGQGIRDAWTARFARPQDIPLPPGYTERTFAQLWPDDRRWQETADATLCRSLASELAVHDCGTHAAVAWAKSNATRVPKLMVRKAVALTRYCRPELLLAGILCVVGFVLRPADRRTLTLMVAVVALYVVAVALTHVVYTRFLVPILPPMYVAMSVGVAGAATRWRRTPTAA